MVDQPIDRKALRNAQFAAATFGGAFSTLTVVLLVLIAAVPVARPERTGFMLCSAAAAVSLWTVWWFVRQALHPAG